MAFPENTVNDTGIKHIWDKVTAALSGKVDKVSGKGLSTNDYTTAEKDKLAGIESGAQVNTVTSVAGKTGAVTLDKADVGLGNVDNTSDANKPISTATQNALDTKADTSEVASTQTLTGNPITITDAAGINAEALKVEFSPKQDLHGQDFPWVGGAGKNKLNPSYFSGATGYTVNSDQTVTVTASDSRAWGNVATYSLSAGSYVFSRSGTSGACAIRTSLDSYASDYAVISGGQTSVAFTLSNDCDIKIKLDFNAGNYPITEKIMIESGSQATDYAPYSNICPITGYTEVGVEDTGINQWDEETKQGYYNASTGAYVNVSGQLCTNDFIPVNPSTTYYCKKGSATNSGQILFYDAEKHYLSYLAIDSFANKTFQTPANCYYMTFNLGDAYGTTYNNDISINYPSTDHDYHAYQHSQATIPFSQTLYGGVSDFVEGGTDDEIRHRDLGDLTYTYDSTNNQFYSNQLDDVVGYGTSGWQYDGVQTSCYRIFTGDYSVDPTIHCRGFNNGRLYIIDTRFTNPSDLKTALTGQDLCYPKATPTTIQTPPTGLKLLQGTNNLTTNGTTITLDYIPNNSIGDAVKASEEYTDRAVERVIPKAKLACFYEIFDESGTLYDATIPEDCNFFLVEYRIQNRIGSTLIKAKSIDFYIPVVVNVGGEQHWVEFLYNSIYHTIDYTSNVTTGFGVLSIYTI